MFLVHKMHTHVSNIFDIVIKENLSKTSKKQKKLINKCNLRDFTFLTNFKVNMRKVIFIILYLIIKISPLKKLQANKSPNNRFLPNYIHYSEHLSNT